MLTFTSFEATLPDTLNNVSWLIGNFSLSVDLFASQKTPVNSHLDSPFLRHVSCASIVTEYFFRYTDATLYRWIESVEKYKIVLLSAIFPPTMRRSLITLHAVRQLKPDCLPILTSYACLPATETIRQICYDYDYESIKAVDVEL